MKKLIPIVFLIVCPLLINAQLSGDGSSFNPFRGTINSSVTWSAGEFAGNIIYVGTASEPDVSVVNGGHLTIEPGITVIMSQLNSDLFITGTGQLTAGGTGEQVIFTRDPEKTHWGHVSFQNMGSNPPPSTITNCIFEHGYSVGTSAQPLLAGGAIQVDFNNVTISDCIFRNNYATYAGAVMINSNRNTKITNCYFESNEVFECGGAMIIYTNSTAEVSNCIFARNYSKGNATPSYSGGAIWSLTNSSKIINCTFIENKSDRPGDAVYSYSSQNMRIINSVFWGSDNQFAGASNTSTFVTCAFESSRPANAISSITISSEADDHFKDAVNGDWSLVFTSPCRDAGTDSYNTPNIVPATDYLGNERIMTTDIGAFEVQYSRWRTTASSPGWNTDANWDGGVPTSARDVIIPADALFYPTESPGPDFTIGSGKQMIIEAGAKASLNNLTNNGVIKLNHNTTDFASLILNNYTRGSGGTEEIELYLSGGGSELNEDYKWHYISSPVASLSTDMFTEVTDNLAQYIEDRPVFSLMEGWVAYDGYVYATGRTDGPTFSALAPGKGYNYFNNTDNTYTFGGSFNTSDETTSLTYTIGTPQRMHGFNLLGNPFSSGLNWDDIIEGIYFPYPANTSKGLYFTRDNQQCSYIAGVGVPSDVTGIIPPMQGFFNKTSSAGNVITLPAAARTHENIHSRYKGSGTIPLVRLAILEDDVSNDETVVRFSEMAKTGLDNDYDALKMFLSEKKTTIHTSLEGVDYAINGQPFPESILEIPVVINVISDQSHKIASTQLQGLEGYELYLTDKSTGFTANLKTTPVLTFSSEPGLISDRFILKIDISTGTEDIHATDNSFNIYQNFGNINIQTLADAWDGKTGSVKIMDMSGKIVTDLRNTGFSKTSVTEVQAPASGGLYFIEISSGMNRYVGKVMIK